MENYTKNFLKGPNSPAPRTTGTVSGALFCGLSRGRIHRAAPHPCCGLSAVWAANLVRAALHKLVENFAAYFAAILKYRHTIPCFPFLRFFKPFARLGGGPFTMSAATGTVSNAAPAVTNRNRARLKNSIPHPKIVEGGFYHIFFGARKQRYFLTLLHLFFCKNSTRSRKK